MAGFTEYLTAEGERMLAKMLNGTQISFTKVACGDGTLAAGQAEKNMTSMINEVTEIEILSVNISGGTNVIITANLSSEKINQGFYFREKGIYMSDGETEVLGIYANKGSDAELIEPYSGKIVEKKIKTILSLSTSDNINIEIKSSAYANAPIFPQSESLEEFLATEEAASITKGEVVIIGSEVYTLIGDDPMDENNYSSSGGAAVKEAYDKATEVHEEVTTINTYLSNRVEEYADLALVDALTALCDNHMPTSGKPYNGIFKCTGGWYTYDIYYHGNYWSGHIVKHITGEFHSIYKAKDSAAVIANSFSDLKAAAFAGIANNCTTTAEGYVLAAQQGKELQDQINEQNNNFKNTILTNSTKVVIDTVGAETAESFSRIHGFLDDNGARLRFAHYGAPRSESPTASDELCFRFDGTNFYAIGRLGGADTVTKKLGSGTLKMVSLGSGQGKSNYNGASVVETFTIPDDIPLENCQVLAVAISAGGSHSSDGDGASYSMSLATAVSGRTVTVTSKHSHSHSNRQTLYLNYEVYAIYIE